MTDETPGRATPVREPSTPDSTRPPVQEPSTGKPPEREPLLPPPVEDPPKKGDPSSERVG